MTLQARPMLKIRSPRDFWSGALFVAFGAGGLLVSRDYALGSAIKMGPGYLPTIVCWGLIGLGSIILVKGLAVSGPRIEGSKIGPQLAVLAAIVAVRSPDRAGRPHRGRRCGRGGRDPRHQGDAASRSHRARRRHGGALLAPVRGPARPAAQRRGAADVEVLHNLGTGFGAAATLTNLGACLLGCLLGTLIGVLPGIGPITTIALLLPVTYGLDRRSRR